ncbi:MAG: hypothetical protein RJB61_2632 [Actinomycetota bacterium]
MSAIPFVTLDDPRYGEVVDVAPHVRRVITRNPSKFTYHGSGTYIVGTGDVVVIDPGPVIDSHREALAAALAGSTVRAILVTHCHSDHSPLSAWLKEFTGAPTVAFGPHRVNPDWIDDDVPDDPDPDELAAQHEAGAETKVEESLDLDFEPDLTVADGDIAAAVGDLVIRAVHTPGHTSNHMCYWLEHQRILFTGDHVMGWSTTVITPPDGDMRDYFASLDRVRALSPAMMLPTHGAPVTDAGPFLDAFVAHRREREAQVLAAVQNGTELIPDIVRLLYVGVSEKLYKAAGRSVLAHLIKLIDDGVVRHDGERPGVTVRYRPA